MVPSSILARRKPCNISSAVTENPRVLPRTVFLETSFMQCMLNFMISTLIFHRALMTLGARWAGNHTCNTLVDNTTSSMEMRLALGPMEFLGGFPPKIYPYIVTRPLYWPCWRLWSCLCRLWIPHIEKLFIDRVSPEGSSKQHGMLVGAEQHRGHAVVQFVKPFW